MGHGDLPDVKSSLKSLSLVGVFCGCFGAGVDRMMLM